MKHFTLFILAIFLSAGIATAQMIEDFEHIRLNLMLGDDADNSSMSVVPTPEGTTNTSTHVVKYERSMNGVPWGGFWSALPTQLDLSVNKYIHVRVMKPRISPLKFKVEGGPSANLEIFSINEQTVVDEWEDIVFDFSDVTGEWNVISFMPDFEDPLTLTEDIVIYFDYIMANNDPTPGSDAAYVIEDFDHILLNIMLGDNDNSSMSVVANPDPDDVNSSNYVVRFNRSMNGVPWGGFWSALPAPIDLTTNKYMYVKVWKPRISPLKFKLEGGSTANPEIFSMTPQANTEQWEEIIFDFSDVTGTWNVISFMPDFEDPMTLTEDIVIYFDDIRLMPEPVSVGPKIALNKDLQVFPNPAKDFVNIRAEKAIKEVKIFDLTGKVVLTQNHNSKELKIGLDTLKEGLYLIQITTENQVFSLKLIH